MPPGHDLTLLHGFTQSAGCWAPVDRMLADLPDVDRVTALDLPGHGSATDVVLPFADAARYLAAQGLPGTWIGYSLGGRLALRVALDAPDLVERLVLIGASPGLADAGERADRREADDRLAERVEAIGVDAFLDEWLDQPLLASLPEDRRHLDVRRRNTAAGLAGSLRTCGTGAMEPLWDRLPRLGAIGLPVLLVTGAADTKFTAIAERMADGIGASATHVTLPGAGHTAHLEQPDAFLTTYRDWSGT